MPENEISWKNIKTLYEATHERGGGYELRIGCWIVNGREGEPVLERREWWATNQGERRQGKQKGLTKSDLYRVFSMAGELSQLLGFPLPKEFAGAVQAPTPQNDAPAPSGSRF